MMWIQVAIAIEILACVGLIGILVTQRTQMAFLVGFNAMAVVVALYALHGSFGPRLALGCVMLALYLARMNWALFAWTSNTALGKLDTRIPRSSRLALPFILTNAAGWAYCLPFYFVARRPEPLDVLDALAVLVYLVGTVFHFGSDYQKRRFKRGSVGTGRLLDTGFWSLCRHPNYFGDFLIYVSFALLGRSLWGWLAPAVNLLQYFTDAIPKNERWAAEHYGESWAAYCRKATIFLPWMPASRRRL